MRERIGTIAWYVVPYLPLLYPVCFENMNSYWWQSFVIFSVIFNLGFQRIAYEVRRRGRMTVAAIQQGAEKMSEITVELKPSTE